MAAKSNAKIVPYNPSSAGGYDRITFIDFGRGAGAELAGVRTLGNPLGIPARDATDYHGESTGGGTFEDRSTIAARAEILAAEAAICLCC